MANWSAQFATTWHCFWGFSILGYILGYAGNRKAHNG